MACLNLSNGGTRQGCRQLSWSKSSTPQKPNYVGTLDPSPLATGWPAQANPCHPTEPRIPRPLSLHRWWDLPKSTLTGTFHQEHSCSTQMPSCIGSGVHLPSPTPFKHPGRFPGMQRWSSSVGDGKQKRKVEPALKRTTPAKRRPPPLGRELGGGDFYWEGLGKVQELRPQLNLLPLPPPPLLPPYLATA
mmetsp:Transcript_2718/g.7693  ORF Transcript_2718/g.7693 Transcript_2718/m.7693 type:complete len:190 (-) Transcript_2718:105-674(-)